ncbi:MAG: adenylate/guanylate cyclase domain-containing protein [Dongiaceae bacterium]
MRERRRWRPTVAAALFIGFGGLVALASSAAFLTAAFVAERNTSELVSDTAELYLENMELRFEGILEPAYRQVDFVARHLSDGMTPLDDDQRIADLLLGTLASGADIAGIAYISPDLRAIYAGTWLEGHDTGIESFVTWPEMRLLIRLGEEAEETMWSEPIYMEFFGTSFMMVMSPVRTAAGYQGIAVAAVSLPSLSRALDLEAAEQPGIVAFALRGEEHVIAHPTIADGLVSHSAEDPVPTRHVVHDAVLANLWEADRYPIVLIDVPDLEAWELRIGDDEHIVLTKTYDGYGDLPHILGIHFPRGEAGGYVDRLFYAVYVGIAILLFSVIAAWLIGRAIGRPVRRLAGNADRIAQLDFTHATPLPSSPFRETDDAAGAFNAMLRGVRFFETYLPRRLVERLMQKGESGDLVSEQRDVTVLFTDIVGFTSIGERLTAEQLSAFLNRHFTMLAECIEAEDGTIDKYIGDSIMAFWNAPFDQPDHADRAMRAARCMAGLIAADNERRLHKELRPVRLRIGIHTGPALAGNIGAPGRVNYTLVGDTVNTAQRLEALGKELQPDASVSIVVSETVVAALHTPVPVVPLGNVVLRGRHEPLNVFGVRTEES